MDFFEMQALERANLTRQDFEPRQNDVSPKQTTRIKERATRLPVEFPENRNYPSFKAVFDEENKKQIGNKEKNEQLTNKLQELLQDPDAALLGGLIMLLRSEGADETLLAALSYILL